MKKCHKCGEINVYGAKVCAACGCSLQEHQSNSVNELHKTAKIIIERKPRTVGSIQNHEVYLNNIYVGELKNSGKLEVPTSVGTHSLMFKSKIKKMGQDETFSVVVSEDYENIKIKAGFTLDGVFSVEYADEEGACAKKNKQTHSNTGEIKYTLNGINGQLCVFENKIEIRRKGIFALATQGLKGVKTIPLSSIKSIQVKKSGLTQGYIQFGVLGGVENRGGVKSANYDENTVTFGSTLANKIANEIKEHIENKLIINPTETKTAVTTVSEADELMKFKKLLDDGVITQEEFDAKKKQILGL